MTVSSGLWSAVTVLLAGASVVVAPNVPCAVAVFRIEPASTSAWVTVYVAVQTTSAFGASVAGAAGVQPIGERPVIGSVTFTFESVTVPALCPVIV